MFMSEKDESITSSCLVCVNILLASLVPNRYCLQYFPVPEMAANRLNIVAHMGTTSIS